MGQLDAANAMALSIFARDIAFLARAAFFVFEVVTPLDEWRTTHMILRLRLFVFRTPSHQPSLEITPEGNPTIARRLVDVASTR